MKDEKEIFIIGHPPRWEKRGGELLDLNTIIVSFGRKTDNSGVQLRTILSPTVDRGEIADIAWVQRLPGKSFGKISMCLRASINKCLCFRTPMNNSV